ncbi:MAG TPA: TonB-dependent receptor [Flavobacterium sp.]|jgi:iron complex outermembrane receptor protein
MKTISKKLLFLLLFLPLGMLAQGTLGGTVLDKGSGQPLPGVNIVVQGTTNGVSTDFDGKFLLSNVKSGDVVVFSYIGFKDVTLSYQNQGTVTISLEEDVNQISEVVVQVGYGTARRRDVTGAVNNLTAEQFNKGPLVSADQLLQGRVSGVQITNSGGSPGEGATVRIRSGSSLNATNDPLYVIDGVPVDTGGGGVQGGRNPLANINQNDIASMTILKDAAATAIYGSRASNGVIIITTKRGRSGEMKVTYNGSFQVNEIANRVDVLSAKQYREFVNQYGQNEAGENPYALLLGSANTDWQDQIYRTATGHDHNIGMSGGSENIVYRASVGYTDINGILKHDNFKRTTLSANVTGNFFDQHLKIDLSNKSSLMENNYSEKGAIGAAISFDPTQAVHDSTFGYDYFQWLGEDSDQDDDNIPDQSVNAGRNPVSLLEQKHNFGNSTRSLGNIQFEYKVHSFEDLKLIANFGYDYASGRGYGSTDENFVVLGERGSYYENLETKKNMLMDLYFNYNKSLESINTTVDVTGGYNYQDFRYESVGNNFTVANGLTDNNPVKERLNLQSFFGRATVTIADKLILMGSFRADGSSRFIKENRWGYFPAAAVAWRINESFLKESPLVSELKLRASWGITGQQDIGKRYPAVALYSSSTSTAEYPFGYDETGNPIFITPFRPQPYNPNLVWEETETINLGLDYGFLNNRVIGSAEIYRRKTNDLIVFTPNPQGVGFSNADFYNIGDLENEGVELSMDVFPLKNDTFTWRIGANVTFQRSEITKLTLVDDPSYGGIATGGISGGTGTTIQNHQVGYAPNSFLVFEQAYDAAGSPIDGVYVDRNNDGIINNSDLYRAHKPAPDVFYGFNTDLTYKNWWFSMNWRGSAGNYAYNNVYSNFGNRATALPTNGPYLQNASPNVLVTNFAGPRYLSDYYVQDASFLRLDNVTLGYTFKNVFDEGSDLRLTGAVQNVLVITGYNGVDPEIANGIDNNLYPRPRTYTLGMNINF